jgi:beta-aspartyl-dipeptidase (metallo-type)
MVDMLLLIRNADVYAPEHLGHRDILVSGGRILALAERIDAAALAKSLPCPLELYEAEGLLALPGLVDCHVHALGGGGEGGFATRTPELVLSDCLRAGVTTIVGTLGTDGVARSMEALVAKVYALREEGISAWAYSGSYRVPQRTVTGDLMRDIMMVEPIIGAGEVAISDHRSSRPTIDELGRIASEARVAGLLSGKAGVVNFHLGDAPARLKPLEELVAAGDLPRTQFLPTHCNRSAEVFDASLSWAASGGWVDITTSTVPQFIEEGEVKASVALRRLREAGFLGRTTCSSDGQGSMPLFDAKGVLAGLTVASSSSLWETVSEAILAEGLPIGEAAATITSNPATILKLRRKGRLAEGADADLLLVEPKGLAIRGLVAMGRVMMRDGAVLAKGNFEK